MLPIIDNAADSLNRGGTVYSRASSNTGSELYSAYQKSDNLARAAVNILFAGCTDVDRKERFAYGI